MTTFASTAFATAAAGPRAARSIVAGRIVSGLAIAFLAFDTIIKVLQLAPAIESTVQLGYPRSAVFVIGLAELVCLALYAWPRTAVLGAILLTAHLGGAVATHVRVESPLLSHQLFPTYVASLVWGGLWLRDARVRALLPFRR
jgi:hypothetical protein